MPFWFQLILSIIFVYPIIVVSGLIITAVFTPLFNLIPLGFNRYKTQYIPWVMSFLITFILGFIFLYNKKHIGASGMFLISSCCLGPLIPFFGNFLVPFSESFRNVQFSFMIISSLYFCNAILYQYQLLAIGIGIICILLFALYIIFLRVLAK
jgi:hypothetical protein